MSEEIRRLSDVLVRDPASRAFVPLADALRRAGDLATAERIAVRGLERHPYDADAHDTLARIHADRGDLDRAADEWSMALRLDPRLTSAQKGLGFIDYRRGMLESAERWLGAAAEHDDDPSIARALATISRARATVNGANGHRDEGAPRPPVDTDTVTGSVTDVAAVNVAAPSPVAIPVVASPPAVPDAPSVAPVGAGAQARQLFAPLMGNEALTALLLDSDGLVLAGAYVDGDGRDIAEEVGAELAGVSDEAARSMRHLGLGAWTSLQVEADAAIVAMTPAPHGALLLVAAARETPVGLVRVILGRALAVAREWLARFA
ncbi:MAG TPA: roadblock/LC7 domain-containing protein [Gemmatimonadaceae bacterium]|nr:roadblock/LC7 domain-containing protein [Gemmatimonadaceae bacterium]